MTRQSKTPKQRAEEALGVAQRRVNKLQAVVTRLERDLTSAKAELADARERHVFLSSDPALKQTTTSTGATP
jgi:4-diphosphocytidyl-2C-methyl-D-erythritol kinase